MTPVSGPVKPEELPLSLDIDPSAIWRRQIVEKRQMDRLKVVYRSFPVIQAERKNHCGGPSRYREKEMK